MVLELFSDTVILADDLNGFCTVISGNLSLVALGELMFDAVM